MIVLEKAIWKLYTSWNIQYNVNIRKGMKYLIAMPSKPNRQINEIQFSRSYRHPAAIVIPSSCPRHVPSYAWGLFYCHILPRPKFSARHGQHKIEECNYSPISQRPHSFSIFIHTLFSIAKNYMHTVGNLAWSVTTVGASYKLFVTSTWLG